MFLQSRRRTRLIKIAVWAAVLGLLLGVLSSLALATGADAHAALSSIRPANGARLTQAPSQVVLTFDEPIGKSFATVTVTDGSGTSVSDGRAVVRGAVVTQRLASGLASGTYTVAFRVVSDDGHPVSDRSTFTLSLPAGGPAPAPATATATSEPVPTEAPTEAPMGSEATPVTAIPGDPVASGSPASSTSLRVGLAVGVGALALAAGTALVALSRRGRAS